jgi:CheY-like chemotaxis protein
MLVEDTYRTMTNRDAQQYSILVVDDDPTFCTIMKELLRQNGFDVRHAYSVEEALERIREREPDLILTDVMMPDSDGLTFIRYLRSSPRWSHIPTIVISARVMPAERAAASQAGADAFIPKPFSFSRLRSTIDLFLLPQNDLQ